MDAMSQFSITPSLEQFFPERTFIAQRSSMKMVRRIFEDNFRLDTVTGSTLALAGKMPLICSRNVATPLVLDFFHNAGLETASNLLTYENQEEAVFLAGQFIRRGWNLAYTYPPPDELGTEEGLLVPVSLYSCLNDKESLDWLAGDENLPPHILLRSDSFPLVSDFFPDSKVFLKACSREVSGGGVDIHYCPDIETRTAFPEWLSSRSNGVSGVRVELALDIKNSWCINVAICEKESLYLGAAIQLFSQPAKQEGSRIDPDNAPSTETVKIALDIAERARKLGYRGLAGFDIGQDNSGRSFVFDLNFRFVSSTGLVLLHDWASERVKARVSESWDNFVLCPLAQALDRIREFAEKGFFVPTRLYEGTDLSDGKSLITGFVVADSVREIANIDQKMKNSLGDMLE